MRHSYANVCACCMDTVNETADEVCSDEVVHGCRLGTSSFGALDAFQHCSSFRPFGILGATLQDVPDVLKTSLLHELVDPLLVNIYTPQASLHVSETLSALEKCLYALFRCLRHKTILGKARELRRKRIHGI